MNDTSDTSAEATHVTAIVPEAASHLTSLELHMSVLVERISSLKDIEQITLALGMVEGISRLATAAKGALNARLIELMKEAKVKQVLVGDVVARKMSSKKIEKPRAGFVPVLEAAIEIYEGDIAKLADLIAADGIKPGSLKKLVGQEKFDELYTTEWKDIVVKGEPMATIAWIPKHLIEGDADAAE
jgi:hypothetical protein